MIQLAQININYFYQQIKQNCANYLYINKLSKILLSRCIKQNQLSNELRPLEFGLRASVALGLRGGSAVASEVVVAREAPGL
jgi:hypothetical protein